ncbi:gamma-butyrolactone biosynthesis enzyme [Streptomyces sp. XM83C]|uniref:ScbA/BarX family gamma-butyrolactone biosynthesis protein n=1 Tax=Streptomyces sp. NPDC006186 TaxID=3155248 RepID=UPI001FF90CEB|nr:ScbA/BarX family gamma-butyrolactone biosynthesis protein [Streptomyces sp. XM83C]MCK1818526.1 gamma-butyrolactone biosynthesis enzyme [Streptomyces sp. XM83C]
MRTAQQAIQLQHERYTTGSDSGQGLTRTVPREYTHRAAVAEVFLTDWKPGRSDGFLVHAQWPRGHSFFAPRAGFQDPMLVAESFRQAGALIAHAELGVPLGHSFMMRGLSYTATPEGLAADLVPTEVELEVTCPEQSWRGGKFTGMRYEATLLRDGRSIGFAEAAFSCLSPEVYRRLRGDRPTSAPPAEGRRLDPASVGRAHQGDVVLLEPEGAVPRWRLYVDTLHPILFDHPVDHVPGMVLMEAARQAAQAVHPMPVLAVAMESTFSRYAELDAPCWIEAETTPSVTDGPALVHVRAVQNDSTVFTAQVTTWHL